MGTATIVLAGEPAPGTPLVAELPDDVVAALQNVDRLPNVRSITFESAGNTTSS